MKLKNVQIKKYKCIEDTTAWRVDQVTCLVGKNEAGKSAILEALYKLNPVEAQAGIFTDIDYPRRFVSTDEGKADSKVANVLTTHWVLDQADLDLIGAQLPEVILCPNAEIEIRKGYDNDQYWTVPVEEEATVEALINGARFNAAESQSVGAQTTLQGLTEALGKIENSKEKHSKLLGYIKQKFPKASISNAITNLLTPNLPKFVLFRDYEKLPGRVSINDLLKRSSENRLTFGHRIFLALLDLVNSDPKKIAEAKESERLIMELEGISNRLTEEIFEYWSQNRNLEVLFQCDMARTNDPAPYNDGWIFSTRIRNNRHRVSVNFDERSSGFTWFFSFLVWFSQMKKNYSDKLIVLLDEPGLTLHGKAQHDLLRYFREKLRPEYQVIYTTHSPFMIDPENPFALRTVEDRIITFSVEGQLREQILGTKVGEEILSGDRDTILPLQGILGYDIAQTLFVGPYVLVVEGPSEWAYINWFARKLATEGRVALDIRWAIAPAEGAPKVTSFVTLFKGKKLKIAALMDYHEGQKGMVDKLAVSNLLEPGHLLKTTDFSGQTDADIEDLIGWELYAALVNGALGIPPGLGLPPQRPEGCELRIAKEAEKQSKLLPISTPEFDHYAPARYLNQLDSEQISKLPGLNAALDKFEVLFQALNALH